MERHQDHSDLVPDSKSCGGSLVHAESCTCWLPWTSHPLYGVVGWSPNPEEKTCGSEIGLTMRGGPVFLLSAQTFRWESSNPGSTSFLTG